MSEFPVRDRLAQSRSALGYWFTTAAPLVVERVTASGHYDFVVLDEQHGTFSGQSTVNALIAVTAGGGEALVRVPALDATAIGRALDLGAGGVIVPLIQDGEDARRAVQASSYPPGGTRSYGPLRPERSRTLTLSQIDQGVLCIVMIETANALHHLDEICATPGLGGVYIGPSDLRLALGGSEPTDPRVEEQLEAAVDRVLRSARAHRLPAGIHTPDGETAARRLEQGFDFVCVASDPSHLTTFAAAHAATAVSRRPQPTTTTTPGSH
jgi:4-hydroxy-2-oxoheptanedioate aldolase